MINYDLRHHLLSMTVFVSAVLGSKSRILTFSEDLVVKVTVHSVDCHEFVDIRSSANLQNNYASCKATVTSVSPSGIVFATKSPSLDCF